MKTGKTSAATLGLVGGLVLGAWIGAELTMNRAVAPEPTAVSTEAVQESPAATVAAKPKRATRVTRVARTASSDTVAAPMPEPTPSPRLVMTIPVSAPEFHARIKPVLARGTKLPLAVEGFSSAEQFATLAHAARNTQVPFILLKHRVISEGQSLEEAIRASKSGMDAKGEVARARAAARSDIAALSHNTTTLTSSN